MISFFLKASFLVIALSPAFFNKVDAYCSRCVKIEEEREREQRDNPQPAGYYDDQAVPLRDDKNSQTNNTPSHSKKTLTQQT